MFASPYPLLYICISDDADLNGIGADIFITRARERPIVWCGIA